MPHRGENKRNSTLRCTKTGGIQPKLNVACFVQSCLTDADFVIFSNYCLIGTRRTDVLFYLESVIRLSTRRKFVGVGEAANLHAPHGSAPQLRLLLFKLSQFAPRANWGFRFPFKEIRFRFRRRRRANPRLCLQFLSFSISVIAVPSAQGISAPRIFAYVGASSTV